MGKNISYGRIVAERYRRQYYDGRTKKWDVFPDWPMQPKQYYTVLLELKSKEAIEALLNCSWVRYLPRKKPISRVEGEA